MASGNLFEEAPEGKETRRWRDVAGEEAGVQDEEPIVPYEATRSADGTAGSDTLG